MKKNKTIFLLKSCLKNNNKDDIAEQEKSLSELKKSIDEDRTYRKLYKGDNIMDEKEESRKRLEKEIFETCKKENRNPDSAEINMLLNFEKQRFFEKISPGVDEMLKGGAKAITEKPRDIINVTQKLSDLK